MCVLPLEILTIVKPSEHLMDPQTSLKPMDARTRAMALLETLDLLVMQARVSERVLPLTNYEARAAIAALGELARQAHEQAKEMVMMRATLDRSPSSNGQQLSSSRPSPLSPREQQVLARAAKGLTNKQIANQLDIKVRTVEFHMGNIFCKTDTWSRTAAVTVAVAHGWLPLDDDDRNPAV
jgi:DNA-binding NarL/FixJ family response regulator